MKRIIALICAAVFIASIMCACDAMDGIDATKQKASEAVSDLTNDATKYSGDNKGLFDDNKETSAPTPTNSSDALAEENTAPSDGGDSVGENLDGMLENGQVEDGDGNIGGLENSDGDSNIDENAAEYAQEQISSENNEGMMN